MEKFCSKCGNEINKKDKFCAKCGYQLKEDKDKFVAGMLGIFLGVFALTAVLVYVIPVIVSLSDFKI